MCRAGIGVKVCGDGGSIDMVDEVGLRDGDAG